MSAEILIVNHALLVAGRAAGGVLPPFRALVIDEAQHLEGALTSQLTAHASHARFFRALDAWGRGRRRGTGLLAEIDGDLFAAAGGRSARLTEAAGRLRALQPRLTEAARRFFGSIALAADGDAPYAPRARYRTQQELLDAGLEGLDEILALGAEAEPALAALVEATAGREADPRWSELHDDAQAAHEEWRSLIADLARLADPRGDEHVHWRSGGEAEHAALAAAPVEVEEAVRSWILDEIHALALVSATLRVGEGFEYVRGRLGLDASTGFDVRDAVYPSPFDWPSQVRALVAGGAEEGPDAVVDLVARLRRRVERNTLVLFTSHRALRRARERLAERLGPGVELWAQDVDGKAAALAERFRRARGAVLLGTTSLWEGVDFPGEALEVLVVAKLPFSVPDEPLVEARSERVEAGGGSGFRDVLLPEAVLRFRQGIGRLVRRRSDRGVIVIADRRVVERSYGRVFQAGLPVPLERAGGTAELVERAAAFLDRTGDEARR